MKKFVLGFIVLSTVSIVKGDGMPYFPVYPIYPIYPSYPAYPIYPVSPVVPVIPVVPVLVPNCYTVTIPIQTWKQVWTLVQGWVWKLETVYQYQVVCR